MEIEPIIQLAKAFRNAIVSVPKNEFETGLGCTNFPHACCDEASLLLAAFLTDNGHEDSYRVHGIHGGSKEELRTHVWLSYSGLIIDITADQFISYEQPPIIVVPESNFHKTFEIESKEVADFRVKFENDLNCLSSFSHDYERVLSRVAV
ncbi:hypothetical protein [Vreelandella alkaliphila]|uniref:Uncharacterized protein n=1 Tax=Vreelandella alkaliphila TaxID=272774 RepID=A0AAJ2RY26_9GAMM|nr:hypothetical protein [Halomonas alkaliphila]MDX5976358.1 hypothetical protein [Halomonas alkaliphila]